MRRKAKKHQLEVVEVTTPKRDIATRWGGDPVIVSKGFVGVPVNFLTACAELKPYCLTVAEMLFVIEVMCFKWDQDAPYPGYKKIASRMGVTEQYARKLARSLEGKGFLHRIARVGRSNAFDFSPLFERIVKHANTVALGAERAKKRAA
ncbi:MAG: hypothetical protein Q8Q14_02215 [Gemmatimonadales bacterium]|nr:hypothetical protein [Gemmatimonadales bacterium]